LEHIECAGCAFCTGGTPAGVWFSALEGSMVSRSVLHSLVAACVSGVACSALADPPPSYGFDFATVGAVNNPGTTFSLPGGDRSVGSVGYEYRISKTEVVTSQWLEFVRAYAPYKAGQPGEYTFTGTGVVYNSRLRQYFGATGEDNDPVGVGWEYAARYCNWLHNGKANTREAFESGVYDTSTFTVVNGRNMHNTTHAADAKFWLPSLDEWVKATYYDPNRFGENQGGYWQWCNSKDREAIAGVETNADPSWYATHTSAGPVGQFADQVSPWGLWDTSGGRSEWTGVASDYETRRPIFAMGTTVSGLTFMDRLGFYGVGDPTSSVMGIRIASLVPAPGTAMVVFWSGVIYTRRSRYESGVSKRARGAGGIAPRSREQCFP